MVQIENVTPATECRRPGRLERSKAEGPLIVTHLSVEKVFPKFDPFREVNREKQWCAQLSVGDPQDLPLMAQQD